jgi:hypothetical protein
MGALQDCWDEESASHPPSMVTDGESPYIKLLHAPASIVEAAVRDRGAGL